MSWPKILNWLKRWLSSFFISISLLKSNHTKLIFFFYWLPFEFFSWILSQQKSSSIFFRKLSKIFSISLICFSYRSCWFSKNIFGQKMETPTMVYSRTLLTCSPFHGSQSYDTKEASSMIAFSAQAKKFPQFLERFFFSFGLLLRFMSWSWNAIVI